MTEKKIDVGEKIKSSPGGWSFDGGIADSFDEHVRRSVPGYDDGHHLVENLAPFFMGRYSDVFYELGCSTGTLTARVASSTGNTTAQFIGIDSVAEMINFANKNNKSQNVTFELADITDYVFSGAAIIASYYTIQFIDTGVRQNLINKIYKNLKWGGAFVLFEKVRGPDARFQDIMTTLYNEYKLRMGYTPDQIISKNLSLKGRLEPFSTQGNLDLLRRGGFVDVNIIFKNLCFEGYLAIK